MPIHRIAPCLWFDTLAEEAANYYVGIFPNSRIVRVTRYGETGKEFHQREPGSVLTVELEIDGQPMTTLNGGPKFKFNESISLQVMCDTQEEVDFYWDRLSAGGDPNAQMCGWLKDKFGVSWQVVPRVLLELLEDHTSVEYHRAITAMFQMKKLDVAAMLRARDLD